MRTTNIIKSIFRGVATSILCIGLSACEPGTSIESETSSSEVGSSYKTGYEFGIKLAQSRQQRPRLNPDEVLKGLLDALSKSGAHVDSAEICETLKTTKSTIATKPHIPARTRGFKDDFAALNAEREGVITLPSSVQYEVLKKGSGNKPAESDAVLINYQGSLADGRIFDTTHDDGEPIRMELDEIAVPGLREALLLMNEGALWRVVIPPKMGFGRSGNNQLRRRDLIYDIELVAIEIKAESDNAR